MISPFSRQLKEQFAFPPVHLLVVREFLRREFRQRRWGRRRSHRGVGGPQSKLRAIIISDLQALKFLGDNELGFGFRALSASFPGTARPLLGNRRNVATMAKLQLTPPTQRSAKNSLNEVIRGLTKGHVWATLGT